jgi:RNA polymerase sigma-70 factor (ECF subfamily)
MFPTTPWTELLVLRQGASARADVVEAIATRYWRPLYLHARLKGLDSNAAQDAVQGLFLGLLHRDFMPAVDPERGRLRSYLRTALDHHLSDERARGRAAKRGGHDYWRQVDIDSAERSIAASNHDRPDLDYDRQWAQLVLNRAFERLREDHHAAGRAGSFALVELYFRANGAVPLDELAEKFAMTRPQLKSFLHRVRGRFRLLVRAEVAATVGSRAHLEDELAVLETLLLG